MWQSSLSKFTLGSALGAPPTCPQLPLPKPQQGNVSEVQLPGNISDLGSRCDCWGQILPGSPATAPAPVIPIQDICLGCLASSLLCGSAMIIFPPQTSVCSSDKHPLSPCWVRDKIMETCNGGFHCPLSITKEVSFPLAMVFVAKPHLPHHMLQTLSSWKKSLSGGTPGPGEGGRSGCSMAHTITPATVQ